MKVSAHKTSWRIVWDIPARIRYSVHVNGQAGFALLAAMSMHSLKPLGERLFQARSQQLVEERYVQIKEEFKSSVQEMESTVQQMVCLRHSCQTSSEQNSYLALYQFIALFACMVPSWGPTTQCSCQNL